MGQCLPLVRQRAVIVSNKMVVCPFYCKQSMGGAESKMGSFWLFYLFFSSKEKRTQKVAHKFSFDIFK